MLTYADVCWRMLTYADVCRRMLTYADVCDEQISAIGNRTTLADGNTWNQDHIALLGPHLSLLY
jgi:hypothetical protein